VYKCVGWLLTTVTAVTTLSIVVAALVAGYVLGRCHSRRQDANAKYMVYLSTAIFDIPILM
jgi:hypothetical protein